MSPPIRLAWSLRIEDCDVDTAFATVADVERYPEFLPGVVGTRIVRRDGGRWLVENSFGVGPIGVRFRSVAEVDPPRRLSIVSRDGPWRDLSIRWRVRPDRRASVLACEASLDFRSQALAFLARTSLPAVEGQLAGAFRRRLSTLAKGGGDRPTEPERP